MLFADAGADRLSAAAAGGVRPYLLLDMAARRGFDVAKAIRWNGESIDLLSMARPIWSDTASPVLMAPATVPLTPLQRTSWLRFAGEMRYANALTIIESALSFDALSRALCERLRVQLEDGSSMLLRLFDNRVLADLLDVLQPDKIDALLAPASAWFFAGRDGEVRVARMPDPSKGATGPYRLALSAQEERALLRRSEPDSIVGILLQQGNPELRTLLPHEQHATVAAHLAAADAWSIEQVPDRTAFVALGLQLGEGFDQQPPWRPRLDAAQRSSKRFLTLLEELMEET